MVRLAATLAAALILSSCSGGSVDESTATGSDIADQTDDRSATDTASPTTEQTSTTTSTTMASTSTTAAATPDDLVPTGSGCGADVTGGQSNVSFVFEGVERTYQLYLPAIYDADTPTPVVLNWHGLGSNGPQQLVFSEYSSLADTEGFIVVSPTGLPAPGDSRNSWELSDDDDPTRDDVAFANTIIDRLIATTCVDESRIYTTGMSNGGYFSSRLVCELADRIAAVSAVAGLTHPDDCQPTRPVPMIAFHGVDDDVVPFNGGGFSSLAPGLAIPLFELVIPDEFAEFAVGFGCDPEPIETTVTAEVTALTYSGCPDGVESIFYRIDGAGHTWPGSEVSSSVPGLGVTNDDISATELSWEFFSRHSLDG